MALLASQFVVRGLQIYCLVDRRLVVLDFTTHLDLTQDGGVLERARAGQRRSPIAIAVAEGARWFAVVDEPPSPGSGGGGGGGDGRVRKGKTSYEAFLGESPSLPPSKYQDRKQ